MAREVEPEELARLIDIAERPRTNDWSFRAALTRYAQPEPMRASAVIELLRRTEAALRPHIKLLERDGPAVWAAVDGKVSQSEVGHFVVDLLRVLAELDRLGDALAEWAVDRRAERPDTRVDAVVADVARGLDDLGVPREQRRPNMRQ